MLRGCGGKPALELKTALTSDLSIFAARLRKFISLSADELGFRNSVHTAEPAPHDDAEFNGMALVLFALLFTHYPACREFCEEWKIFPGKGSGLDMCIQVAAK